MVAMTAHKKATANDGGRNDAPKGDAAEPIAAISFVRASDEHLESGGVDTQRLPNPGIQDAGTFDLPAYGFLSHLYLLVEARAGAGAGAGLTEDGPLHAMRENAL